MDLAKLVLAVDSTAVKTGADQLDKLTAAGKKAEQAGKDVARSTASVGTAATKMAADAQSAAAKVNRASGSMRAGMQQLSFQMGDISTQFAMGTKASTIFAQQSGQVIQALQMMGGEGNKLLRFLGGPWGMVMTAATVAMTPFIAKLFEGRDEIGKLIEEMKKEARQASLNDEAHRVFATTLDGVTEATRKNEEALKRLADAGKSAAEQALEQARAELAKADSIRDVTRATLAASRAQNERYRGSLASTDPRLKSLFTVDESRIREMEAELAARDADAAKKRGLIADLASRVAVENATRDPIEQIRRRYDGLIERTRQRLVAEKATTAEIEKQVRALATRQRAEVEAAQKQGRTGGQGRTAQQAYQDFVAALREQGVNITSGYRTQAQQNALRARLGKDAARYSLHSAHRAVDVPLSATDEQIQAAAAQAGLRGLSIKRKPGARGGAHGHVSWSGAGARGDGSAIEALQERQAREAERELQAMIDRQQAFQAETQRLDEEIISAKGKLVHGVEAQFAAALESIRAEQANYESALDRKVADERLNAADAAALKIKHAQLTAERSKAVELDRQLSRMERQSEANERLFQNRIDELRFADEMATTAGAQRDVQMQLLDVTYQQREAALRELKARLELAGKIEEAARVQAEIDRLPAEKGRDRRRVIEGTKNPLEQWASSIPQTAAEMNEALQDIRVRGFESLSNAITDVLTGTRSLAESFKDMARSIVADIIQMTVRMLIFRAISGMIGGGRAGSDFGTNPTSPTSAPWALGGVFSGGSPTAFAKGGLVSGPTLFPMTGGRTGLMGEAGPEAIMPLARDSRGRLGVRTSNDNAPVEVHVMVTASPELDVRIAQVSATQLGEAAPVIVKAAVAQTMKTAGRPALMGRR